MDHLHYLLDLARLKNPSLEIGQVIRRLKTLAVSGGFLIFLLCHTTKGASENNLSYISAENRLSINDVMMCCGQDAMAVRDNGPCAMGVDVGRELTVVVGFKPNDKQIQVCYLARVSSFNDLHDIDRGVPLGLP